MRRAREVVALMIAVSAAIAVGVLACHGEPSADAVAVNSSVEALGASGSGGSADSDGQLDLSAKDAGTGGEDSVQTSGIASVPEVAASLVCEYERRGDCALVRSGYLDLSGRVWSMVVEGSGWVDVCVVQRGDDGTCETKVMHMDAAEWAASLGELGIGG